MKIYLIFLVFSGITDGNKTKSKGTAGSQSPNRKILPNKSNGNLTVTLSVPLPIVNISLLSSSLDYLEFEWKHNNSNNSKIVVNEYQLTITNNNQTIKTKELKAKFMNLTECTNYCLNIQDLNSVRKSEKKIECFYTKASNLSTIQLSNISSDYKTSRNIIWNYTGSKKCNIIYKLTIINKDTNYTFEIQTNKSSYKINNFTLNSIYLINVKATTNFSTLDNKKESLGSEFEFYTGEKNISIENLNSSMKWSTRELSISWTIKDSFNETISYYMINIIGDSGNCMNGFFYKIQSSIAEQMTGKSRNKFTVFGNYVNESISFNSKFNKTIKINKNTTIFSLEIYGSNRFGIKNLIPKSINYKLEKPTFIPQLEFKEKNKTYFVLKWRTEEFKDINKTIFGYRIKYLNISREFDSNKSEANITSLNQCNKYCFNISTFNDVGSSADSKEYCNSTLAPNLSKIKLENILSGYETSRKLNWTYSGSDKCKINYQLEFWIDNSSIAVNHNITNSTAYQISTLKLNKIYSVRVRPFTEFDTENQIKSGDYSETVKFYTGHENIFIKNLSYSMNWIKRELSISWNIKNTFVESLFNYTIEIRDHSTIITERIIYINPTNKDINGKSDSMKRCDNQTKVNIAINTNFSDKIIFCKKTIKFSVEIFGTNLKGRHKLHNEIIDIEMLKPDPIENFTVYKKDLHSLHLNWTKSGSVDSNKPVMGYRIEDLERKNIINVTDSYFYVSNLNSCRNYCFNISAYNDAGVSSNKTNCATTNTTNLSNVKLNKISSYYRNSRQINWEYLGKTECSVSYKLEYWIKNLQNRTKTEITNETKFEIHNLTLNEIYKARVTPMTIFDTADGMKNGSHSNIVEFFTGAENITVESFKVNYNYYEKKFSLSWSSNASLNFKIDAYLILIKNAQNVCYSVIERRGQNHLKDDEFYKKEKEKLIKDNNCTQNIDDIKRYNDTVNYFDNINYDQSTKEYIIELHTFNKLGFQKVQNFSGQIQIPANSILAVIISLLFILIIACLIYLAIRNREKLNTYFPFNRLLSFLGGSKKTTEKANPQPIQMKENELQPVLDERFFDCNTLSDFLNKIDEHQRSLIDFPNYVKFMSENKDVRLNQEYAKVNSLCATLEHQLKLTKFIGKSPFNLKKNRFKNILPFDQNLVYLKSKSAPDNYLNANYIPFSSDNGSVEYIASQGPIESTISDYILMIWEQNVTCIIMLTRTYEDDKFKCLQYWPDDSREICCYGNQKEFLVAKLYEKEETSYFERKFSLKNTITREERLIYHIHMHMWMDFSAPDLKDFNSVLCRFQDLRDTIVNPPFLVHCSAGVGRTGTFICIDRIVRLINKGQQYVDVFKTVMELRAYRNLLVQRQSQYVFIHEFLNFYIQAYLTDNIQLVSTV